MNDLTTHQSGHMQASAANGFMTTSMADCSGTPFNFQPEYNTAKANNITPWGAGTEVISTTFETGHWEACASLSDPISPNPIDPNDTSPIYNQCNGPYENAGPPDANTPEVGEAPCYLAGATHPGYNGVGTSTPPNRMTGCLDEIFQNGDLDFDGPPYYGGEWPTGPTPTSRVPSSFVEQFPTSNGHPYSQFFFQTDVALSEYQCGGGDYAGAASSWPAAPYRLWGRAGSTRTGASSGGGLLLAPVRQRARRVHVRQGRAVRDGPVRRVGLPAVHRSDAQQPLRVVSRRHIKDGPSALAEGPFAVRGQTACGKLNRRCGS